MTEPRTIAIDGPASSGKSTIGRLLAERLGYLFFDTGAMYRAVTWAALQRGVPLDDPAALTALAESLPVSIRSPASTDNDGRAYSVFVADRDVTWEIRRPEVEAAVSAVSAGPGVRRALVEQQCRVAETVGAIYGPAGIVMAGRDIGTVVLPQADLKIYLDAGPQERARRRFNEQAARGGTATYEETLQDILRRDRIDSTRAASPLRPADGAVRILTDGLSVEKVLGQVLSAAL
ncbi:MAG: (d)CMP kinase [Chloroflexia bacterium]